MDQDIKTFSSENQSKKRFDCPVCYESLVSPVYQCHEGHLLCGGCIRKVSQCPLCRQKLPVKAIRNRAVEEIIEEQFEPCPFRDRGCRVKLKSPEEAATHELECSFALLNLCSMLEARSLKNCDRKVSISEFVDHLEGDHRWHIHFPKVTVGQVCAFTISLPQNLQIFRRLKPAVPNWLVFNSTDEKLGGKPVFMLKVKHVEGRTYFVPYVVGSESKAQLYACKLQVMGEKNIITVYWQGSVLSIGAKPSDEISTCSITEECLETLKQKTSKSEDYLVIKVGFHKR